MNMTKKELTASGLTIKPKGKKLGKRIMNCWQLYLLLLLPLTYLIIFQYIPMLGLQIGLRDYSPSLGMWGSPWVGLKHIQRFFGNYQFGRLIRNTLVTSVYLLICSTPTAVVLALCLNCVRNSKYKKIVQTVTYLPHFISLVVLIGMMYQIFNPLMGTYSNLYRTLFGTEAPNIMGNPNAFYHIYVWSGIWQNTGWSSIIYVAALSAVDTELYEAAGVDGASRARMVWMIDLPSILPTVVILLILNSGKIMSIGYEKALLLQNNFNLQYSEMIPTYVYKQGLQNNGNYSYATAAGLFDSVVNFILIIGVNQVSKRVGGSSLW